MCPVQTQRLYLIPRLVRERNHVKSAIFCLIMNGDGQVCSLRPITDDPSPFLQSKATKFGFDSAHVLRVIEHVPSDM